MTGVRAYVTEVTGAVLLQNAVASVAPPPPVPKGFMRAGRRGVVRGW